MLNKTNNILLKFKNDIQHNKIPLFSLINKDIYIDEIISNSKFFNLIILTDFILIGTGGSSLGAEALIQAHSNQKLDKR